jgi:hypothetical protein
MLAPAQFSIDATSSMALADPIGTLIIKSLPIERYLIAKFQLKISLFVDASIGQSQLQLRNVN